MPIFNYTARDQNGKLIKGTESEESKEAMSKSLADKGLIPTQITEVGKAGGTFKEKIIHAYKTLSEFSTVPVAEKIFFTQNLMVMVRAGISLAKSLVALTEQTSNKKLKKVLIEIKTGVEKGDTLSDSMMPYKKIFGELYINMIATGESSGQLEQVLEQLTNQIKKDHRLVSKVRGALVYPIIVITAMIIIMILMFVFVVPQITAIFTELNAELPLPTKILIAISDFVANNGIVVGAGFFILITAFILAIRSTKGKKIWHKILLKSPIIGPIIKKINLARFSRTVSSLLKTDIPITENFNITAKVLGNHEYKSTLNLAANQLKKGVNIHDTLEKRKDLFPPIVTQMISVGEETGSLDEILLQLAEFYEEEVDQTMDNLTATLEPILMLLLGAGVGSIAVAVIMPMYSLSSAI